MLTLNSIKVSCQLSLLLAICLALVTTYIKQSKLVSYEVPCPFQCWVARQLNRFWNRARVCPPIGQIWTCVCSAYMLSRSGWGISVCVLWSVIVRWEALPSISPLNGCLCVVLVADLRVGRAVRGGLIYSWLWLWPDWLCVCAVTVCVPGDCAVWPPAQRVAETVSAAVPVFQPPATHQSALPLAHLRLLQ